jgi:SAM-dependent methyltransferase
LTTYAEPERHAYLHPPLDAHHRDGVARILDTLGVKAGDLVIELGAGSGRFTDVILDRGVRVLAIEPDPVLLSGLRGRLVGREGATFFEGTIESVPPAELHAATAVVGFHVLHHLGRKSLEDLADRLRAEQDRPTFRGFAFLEPNPWSPLFPIQIAFTPGMRFHEESGLWANDYAAVFAPRGVSVGTLGHQGLIPPPLARRLPASLLPGMPLRTRMPQPFYLYRVVGSVLRRGSANT